MAKKTYEVTGRPLSPPFQVLQGRAVGDTFEEDLDEATERLLVGCGALRVVPGKSKPAAKADESKPAARSDESKKDDGGDAAEDTEASGAKSGGRPAKKE